MSLYCATGSIDTVIRREQLQDILFESLEQIGQRKRVVVVPPDYTRVHSQAGPITCMVHQFYGSHLVDVLPALGTHFPMEEWQIDRMFPTLPKSLIRTHRWREDVVTIGEVPADFVGEVTEGIYRKPWPVQINRLLWEGQHDLIISVGQVVPHEVIGMANFNKNLFIGTGGETGINESHFIGAAYGLERMMGREETPLRKILNYAEEHFCRHLPILYVLTVVSPDPEGNPVLCGLFIGDDQECFKQACALSVEANFVRLDREIHKAVIYLNPEEFQSTWLGNKAIYRSRMALADGAQLIILAPGVKTFGEDPTIDQLIRKYGYRPTPEVLRAVESSDDLRNNLAAAAHLIHGSPEDRFDVVYCCEHLSQEEIESVGYQYGNLQQMLKTYDPARLADGWNQTEDHEEIFFIRNPALGLWACDSKLQ
ncbi:MAG: lactate racemase domain-containing protein [Planctomycetales bacterium]